MIYKYTKCESVIAKIMADADMSEGEMRITDMREWIFEAIEKIGAPMQYIERESGVDDCPILKIEDYQAPIPDDLVSLTAVAYSTNKNGAWIPVRKDNSQFKQTIGRWGGDIHKHHHHHDHHFMHDHPQDDELILNEMTSKSQLYGINGMRYFNKMMNRGGIGEPTFFIKPGWIVFNKKKGFAKISYKAIATDERGYPLIPDTTSYQEAVYWYVMMKLSFPKYLNGKLGGKGVNNAQNAYFYIQQQWNFYRNQAYAEAMMPTESDMIGIKNEWNKLIPEWDSDEVFFKPEGHKQLNYTDYYYGY